MTAPEQTAPFREQDVASGHHLPIPERGGDRWVRICRLDQLTPGRGAAARVAGRQVALFRWPADDVVYAVDNRDPFSGAHVMARGIVGDRGGVPKVAGPVYKQSFDLRTGHCLDDDTVALATFPVRLTEDGWIELEAPS